MNRAEIDEFFKKHEKVVVTFRKKDNTIRIMTCTTKLDSVPVEYHPKGTSTKPENPEVKPVFDIENSGWRSFSIDSIIDIKPLEE